LNGNVYITGGYQQGVGSVGFTLPIGFWPSDNVRARLIMANYQGTSTSIPFDVETDGRVLVYGGLDVGVYYFNTFFPIDPTI